MDSITLANINAVVDARIELARTYMNLTHELDPMNAIVVLTFAGIGMVFVTYRNVQFAASTWEVN